MLSSNKKKVYHNVIFFEETVILRIKDEEKMKIKRICRMNKDIYENLSHYIRCAIIKDLRNFDSKGKLIKGRG